MADIQNRVPKSELDARLKAFRRGMDALDSDWSMALITHKLNMYYLTGTMQDGVLVIEPDSAVLWVRRSLVRAQAESLFADIRPMKSFRTLAESYTSVPETAYVETKTATLEWLGLVQKYLPIRQVKNVGGVLSELRARKSDYEVGLMRRAGAIHAEVLGTLAPTFVYEGISEAELGAKLFEAQIARGGHGITRFNQPLGEDLVGYVAFGESVLFPTAFDGPGGSLGTCIAVQSIGSHESKLRPGSLVYLDCACGIEGYHTDKSVAFYYGDLSRNPDGQRIREAYDYCRMVERDIAARLVPGAVPEEVYAEIMDRLDARYADSFMNGARFLGHSIGLTVDEAPVLAKGFQSPIEANMTFAIEPKIALPGIGMVGTENTYLVTEQGAVSLSGETRPLIEVK